MATNEWVHIQTCGIPLSYLGSHTTTIHILLVNIGCNAILSALYSLSVSHVSAAGITIPQRYCYTLSAYDGWHLPHVTPGLGTFLNGFLLCQCICDCISFCRPPPSAHRLIFAESLNDLNSVHTNCNVHTFFTMRTQCLRIQFASQASRAVCVCVHCVQCARAGMYMPVAEPKIPPIHGLHLS